jgi:hypothetical protein
VCHACARLIDDMSENDMVDSDVLVAQEEVGEDGENSGMETKLNISG